MKLYNPETQMKNRGVEGVGLSELSAAELAVRGLIAGIAEPHNQSLGVWGVGFRA